MNSIWMSVIVSCSVILGCNQGFLVDRPMPVPGGTFGLDRVLGALELSEAQRVQIEVLWESEAERVRELQAAHEATESALRDAELRLPFDETRAGLLVRQQAEIVAYLRGTESRLVAGTIDVLDAAQWHAFARLRAAGGRDPALGQPSVPSRFGRADAMRDVGV